MFHEVIMAFRSFPVLWAPIISMAVYLISLIPLIILKRREKGHRNLQQGVRVYRDHYVGVDHRRLSAAEPGGCQYVRDA